MVSGAAEPEHNAESRQKIEGHRADDHPGNAKGGPSDGVYVELKVTSFSQRYAAFMTYNDVIQRLGANHAEGIPRAPGLACDQLGWVQVAGWMVMYQITAAALCSNAILTTSRG